MRTDIFSTKRARRVAVAVALGGGLALGIAGLAQAADPSPSGSAAPSASSPAGERGGPAGRGEPREHKPHLAGTVKTITDTTITITDRDGFTRQINITAKPEGVAVGTRIHAEGTVNKDGVSLDATEVKVAPDRPAGRPGGGPGRHGGPRGEGGPLGEGGPKGERAAPSEAAPSAPAPAAPSAPAPAAPSAPAPSAPAPSNS